MALEQPDKSPDRIRVRSSYYARVRPIYAASFLLVAACIVDGRYVVRGTVVVASGTVGGPADGVEVTVGDRDATGRSGIRRALTAADGSYAVTYDFGGMYPFISGTHPRVEFAARGYRTCSVNLRGATPEGVVRRACHPPEPGCFVLDVVLSPEHPAPDALER